MGVNAHILIEWYSRSSVIVWMTDTVVSDCGCNCDCHCVRQWHCQQVWLSVSLAVCHCHSVTVTLTDEVEEFHNPVIWRPVIVFIGLCSALIFQEYSKHDSHLCSYSPLSKFIYANLLITLLISLLAHPNKVTKNERGVLNIWRHLSFPETNILWRRSANGILHYGLVLVSRSKCCKSQ